MSEERDKETPGAQQAGETEMSEAEIDKSLMDSFPASDPPPWTLGTDRRTETQESTPEQLEEKE